MAYQLYDTHCHLDFFARPAEAARRAENLGLAFLACTVTPQGYQAAARELAGAPNVRLAVGLHPWWVADGRCGEEDVDEAAALAAQSPFVGEVGVDRSPHHVDPTSVPRQLAAFSQLARASAGPCDQGRRVLSVHSVQAASPVLDILEDTGCLGSCACVFHWFTGSSDELHRAVQAGCLFSVNEMMLRTRRGREYARQIPERQLLTETDLPPGQGVEFDVTDVAASLRRTLGRLAEIRGVSADCVTATCAENASGLLGL